MSLALLPFERDHRRRSGAHPVDPIVYLAQLPGYRGTPVRFLPSSLQQACGAVLGTVLALDRARSGIDESRQRYLRVSVER